MGASTERDSRAALMCARRARPSVFSHLLPALVERLEKEREMAVSAISVAAGERSAARLLPLGGVVFVALVVIAFAGLSGDSPGIADSAATINAYYDSHHGREMIAALVVAAATPFLVLFGTSLASALWPSDGGRRPFWQMVLAGGSALGGAMWLVSAVIHFTLADAADQKGMSGGALQALNALDTDTWIAFNGGMGVLMLGAAGALLARKVRPALGWIALFDGILLFIPYADFFGLIVSGLWIIVTSVLLFRRGAAFASA
jgi:hypothetical protein